MEMPDRIENMTKEQLEHLDMLVDQLDEAFPTDRMDEERLAKDPHLAILPSGRKISTRNVRSFAIRPEGDAYVYYFGETYPCEIENANDLAAFNAALNDIGVYVAAPTLKGDDADGDGIASEGRRFACGDCLKTVPSMDPCPHCGSLRTATARIVDHVIAEGAPV